MDLQHCSQRNVQSISKEKMFVSTVSKYDPRTGRTTRLQNCVLYNELITKDRSPCGFQRYVRPPPPTIIMSLSPNVGEDQNTFYWNAIGSGFVDYGFGEEAFKGGLDTLFSREMNLNGAQFKIYSNNITSLSVQPQQPLINIDVSYASTLVSLNVSSNSVSIMKGLNNCKRINNVNLSNNLITQLTANAIATDLFNTGVIQGTLIISNQSSGTININTTAFLNLKNTRFWIVS